MTHVSEKHFPPAATDHSLQGLYATALYWSPHDWCSDVECPGFIMKRRMEVFDKAVIAMKTVTSSLDLLIEHFADLREHVPALRMLMNELQPIIAEVEAITDITKKGGN